MANTISNPKMQALQRKAEAGDAQAQYELGVAYEYGEFDIVDLAEAVRWIRKAAENGHVHAQFKMSCYCEDGRVGQPDYAAAYAWAEKAARQGLVHAQKQISRFLSLGRGVERNFQQAAWWEKEFLTQEAANGEAPAMYHLGNFWLEGKPGFPRNPGAALQWYAQSARAGYRDAMLRLASLLQKGEVVECNEAEAIEWYERAGGEGLSAAARLKDIVRLRALSEAGDADARQLLGELLGIETDEGLRLLQEAAKMGQCKAAQQLFEFYLSLDDGRSLSSEGRQWTELAAELGVQEAQQYLERQQASSAQKNATTEPDDMIARLRKQAEAGDVIAEITLKSLLSSPLYAGKR